MKKLYSLFAAVIVAASVNAQTTVTYTFSGTNATEVVGGTIDSNLSFVTAKGTSAQSPTFYSATPAAVRIYSDRTTGDGNSVTISVASGYEITGLTFTATTAAFAPPVNYSVDAGTSVAMPLTGSVYNVEGLTAGTSLSFKNVLATGTSNTQLRIPSFTVTYRVKPVMAVGDVNATKANLVKNTVVGNSIIFSSKGNVQVVNMNGQVVKTASVNENTTLDVSTLTKGTYIVTGNVNGKVVSQKIIKK
ncbi:T9SS type A sorting domain-containing protein [Kaistella jeonii]|uniref:T9SS type A sorting domain-containing protein n=1 Tax=Kaistella jeonii TaxID=266749 RepID=UPI00068FDE78|nr:T9SS type A sorting domain-containing protein [Kaistella jeonii]SFC33491.1 Por secretion system C-terminal sorting domain-containing protein [Kaistella jeonii]VEI95525.1 Por secretion system C-terminal sorting domain [Kaistella jeonii]